jgi:hypothetical protein
MDNNTPVEVNYAAPTIEALREQVYNGDGVVSLEPVKYEGPITDVIEEMLDRMYKLTRLSAALTEYGKELGRVKPYFDDNQHLRCYISDSYIVVEVPTSTKPSMFSMNWIHIIESHGADKKDDTDRYYNFNMIRGLTDDNIKVITQALDCVVDTVEQHLFAVMHDTKTVFEKIKMIRIGEKDADELKIEAKAKIKATREVKAEERATKRKNFWNKILGGSKVKFS